MGKFYDLLNNIINKINTNTSSISSINNSMSEMQTEIDKKENKLTDAVSGVPVVFNAANNSNLHITTNATKIAHSGKNMLPYPYIDTTGTKGGITYTDNGDGSITINGTATTTSYFNLCSDIYFGDSYKAVQSWATHGALVFSLNIPQLEVKGLSMIYDGATPPKTFLRVSSGYTIDNVTVMPQIEVGSRRTTWEAYHGKTYDVDNSEMVVPAIDGVNVITCDGDSLSVEYCTENRVWDEVDERIANNSSSYVAANQGAANVGKILVVGADGNLTLTDMPEATNGDVIGMIDENNNIIITGTLVDGTYTFKYENTDGTFADIGSLTIGNSGPAYTNIIDTVGYTNDTRVSTSDGGLRTDAPGYTSTGIIDLTSYTKPRTLRTKGVDFRQATYDKCNFAVFTNASGTFKAGYTLGVGAGVINASEIDDEGNLTISNATFQGFDYIRFNGYGDGANLIVTVNEELPDYINRLNTADADFASGQRLNSSGGTSALTGSFVSGYIPASNGDIVRVYAPECDYSGSYGTSYVLMSIFDSSKIKLNTKYAANITLFEDGHGWSYVLGSDSNDGGDNIAYVRIGGQPADAVGVIVTINEEITN